MNATPWPTLPLADALADLDAGRIVVIPDDTPLAVELHRRGLTKRIHGPTRWANPWERDPDRITALARYRARILGRDDLRSQLHTLRGWALVCWCDRPCHGDVLRDLALSLTDPGPSGPALMFAMLRDLSAADTPERLTDTEARAILAADLAGYRSQDPAAAVGEVSAWLDDDPSGARARAWELIHPDDTAA